jgi:glutamine amidotransferase
MSTVVVLDYGSGNLHSAERAFARVGADVTVTSDLAAAAECDGLVVPGVGAYASCMHGIDVLGAAEVVRRRAADERPVLGICVGMQVLFDRGDEHGQITEGIGVLPGAVTRLQAPVLPHMGWNTVSSPAASPLFRGLAGGYFYFVHSYAVHATDGSVTTAEHGERFVAAVEHGAVAATQFHPEKSGDAGLTLLANWIGTLS